MRKNLLILLLCLLASSFQGIGQKGVTTFGIQYKPIIPNSLIGTFEQDFNEGILVSSVKQKVGHSFGMVVRVGLTDKISLESGINYTQRKFNLDFEIPDSGYAAQNTVGVVSYEIPVSGLIYVRLGDDIYMNSSLGVAMTLFPSDVRTYTDIPDIANSYFQQEGAYRSKLQGAALANLGFEYRTKKAGYFYLGASYHLPFTPIMTFAMSYEYDNTNVVSRDNIHGSYLTLDLRYFFHEKKE
jgi:hypothetical protein